jgi:hypothetical protein
VHVGKINAARHDQARSLFCEVARCFDASLCFVRVELVRWEDESELVPGRLLGHGEALSDRVLDDDLFDSNTLGLKLSDDELTPVATEWDDSDRLGFEALSDPSDTDTAATWLETRRHAAELLRRCYHVDCRCHVERWAEGEGDNLLCGHGAASIPETADVSTLSRSNLVSTRRAIDTNAMAAGIPANQPHTNTSAYVDEPFIESSGSEPVPE